MQHSAADPFSLLPHIYKFRKQWKLGKWQIWQIIQQNQPLCLSFQIHQAWRGPRSEKRTKKCLTFPKASWQADSENGKKYCLGIWARKSHESGYPGNSTSDHQLFKTKIRKHFSIQTTPQNLGEKYKEDKERGKGHCLGEYWQLRIYDWIETKKKEKK